MQDLVCAIKPLDEGAMKATQEKLDKLTKPPGSLGALEELARRFAGIVGETCPPPPRKAAILMAGDHGVVDEGVAAFPQEVTAQMVLNFVAGGAAMNVLCRHAGSELIVVDVGVASALPELPGILNRRVAAGTRNMARGPAMTREEALKAIQVGKEVVDEVIDRGVGLVATGEMGIGNTTSSTAILAVYSGLPVAKIVGRGTGIDDARLKLKIKAIERALEINNPDPEDALDVLTKLGGLEIAGLAGVMLGAAVNRTAVLLDGFISCAAALIAANLAPAARQYFLASHLSEEPGHKAMLELLGLSPLLQMRMRLGEGTGAALAMNLVDAALKIPREMATFEQAGVSDALQDM